jgi:ABC-type Fe3+ transport system permease subunit
MVAHVVLAEPEGLGDAAPPPVDRRGATREPALPPNRQRRGRRIAATTLLVLGCVFSGLCLLVLVSSWRDDGQIDSHQGQAVADVLSVSFNRTAVRFVTPKGAVIIPSTGVLYPSGLAAGERVRVEYDTTNPELVRVAGRDFTLSLLPVGTSLLFCWAIVLPVGWLLRRPPKRPSTA